MKSVIFVSVLFLQCLPGQTGSALVGPPALGFVFDAGQQALIPILGIPGASLPGSPLDLPFPLADAAVSGPGEYILAIDGGDRTVKLLQPAENGFAVKPLEGVTPGVDRLVLSPNGGSAALVRATDGIIQLVRGLPDSPALAGEIHYASPDGNFGPMALSDDGQALLVASSSLALFGPDGLPRPLPLAGPVSAMAFRPQSHDALVADGGDGQVYLIRGVADNPQYQVVATRNDGISEPVGVGFSADGLRAFVANSDTGNILMLDFTGAPPSMLSCACSPTGLSRLNRDSVFRLNDLSDRPLMLLDGRAPQPRVVFVPRERSAQ